MRKLIYTEEYLKQMAGLQNAAYLKQIQGGDFGGNAYGGNAYQQSCRCPYCGRWKFEAALKQSTAGGMSQPEHTMINGEMVPRK